MNKSVLDIWGRKFELNAIFECYPGEEILDNQRIALEQIRGPGIVDEALDSVKKYIANTAESQIDLPIDNIFKFVMPKSLFVPHNKKSPQIAIMCDYKFDAEHGIAIVFVDGRLKEVGIQDIIL